MKPRKMILIDTSIGAFICILYCYEERLFHEISTLYIDIKTDIHYHNDINRLYCIKKLVCVIKSYCRRLC